MDDELEVGSISHTIYHCKVNGMSTAHWCSDIRKNIVPLAKYRQMKYTFYTDPL